MAVSQGILLCEILASPQDDDEISKMMTLFANSKLPSYKKARVMGLE
jgi:hypothetical protein